MTAAAASDAAHDPDLQLRNTLVRLCALSDKVVAEIYHAHRTMKISFTDAALRLGYVTQEDIDNATAWGRKLAVVEKRKVSPGPQLMLAHDPFSKHAEKVRALRTELLLRHDTGSRANIMAVLSPCSGEGRSHTAAELAISFAQLNQATLLVDADLRRPSQHFLFGAENEYGLSQALTNGTIPYVHPVDGFPHLSLLTAGPTPVNPLELLSQGRFEGMLDDWGRRYDHIVIDTAPVNEFSDALAVATMCGRVLALSRARHTPYRATREMLRRLSATQAQMLGAVIHHF